MWGTQEVQVLLLLSCLVSGGVVSRELLSQASTEGRSGCLQLSVSANELNNWVHLAMCECICS